MDSFTSTVKSKNFDLNYYFMSRATLRVSICYGYKNDTFNSWDAFMPPGILEHAFYKTLSEFPILAGYVRTLHYFTCVSVDRENLNMPIYTDTSCDLAYSTMCQSGFSTRKLPIDLCGGYWAPSLSKEAVKQIKPAYFHVVRCKDRSGVFICGSIAYCLADGYRFTHFMNRWAEISRWMQQYQEDKKVPFPTHHYIDYNSTPTESQLDRPTSTNKYTLSSLSTANAFTTWLSELSPEMRGELINTVVNKTAYTCCIFHISSKSIKDFCTNAQMHAPSGTRYSDADIITAYAAIVVARTKEKVCADWWSKPVPSAILAILSKRLHTSKSFDVTMPSKLCRPDINSCMESLTIGENIVFPKELAQAEPTREALSTLASRVHQHIPNVDGQRYIHIGNLSESKPDNYLRLLYSCWHYRKNLSICNHTGCSHHDVDFGAGIPTSVHHPSHELTDAAYVMPANPRKYGYEIELKLVPDVAASLLQDDGWMDLVDKYDFY